MLWKIRFFIRNYLDIFLKCICFIMFPIFVLLLIMLISCDLCPIEFLCRKSRVITRSHKIFTNTLILSCGDLVLYIFFLHMFGWQLKLLCNFNMPVKELVGITNELYLHITGAQTYAENKSMKMPFHFLCQCFTRALHNNVDLVLHQIPGKMTFPAKYFRVYSW